MHPNSPSGAAPLAGLTGGIACGKSEVAGILAGLGAEVKEADEVAHELMAPGTPVHRAVTDRFGSQMVAVDGAIDRKALGRLVFRDAEARADLNAIVHPEVKRSFGCWADAMRSARRPAVAVVPLLFEAGMDSLCDVVICVAASEHTMVARMAERGLAEEEAIRRIRAQMPLPEKMGKSDYVIQNDGSLRELSKTTKQIWNEILNKER